MRQSILEWDESSGVGGYTWTGSKLLKGELDKLMFDPFEDDADYMSDTEYEYRPHNPPYETGSPYEFSDWDQALSFVEQDHVSADIAGHFHLPAIFHLHKSGHEIEAILDQRRAGSHHSHHPNCRRGIDSIASGFPLCAIKHRV